MNALEKMNKRREADLGEGGIPQFGAEFKKHCHRDHESLCRTVRHLLSEITSWHYSFVDCENLPVESPTVELRAVKKVQQILEGK